MMRIPEVRDALTRLAADQTAGRVSAADGAARIMELVPELRRRPPVQISRPSRKGLPSARHAVLAYAAANPGADYHEIAEACGTNIGRVSETLAGKRT